MRNAVVSTRIAAVVLMAVLVAGFGAGRTDAKAPPLNFGIHTLSNRADLISDGNALVEVQVPKNVPMHKVTLTLNGVDVSSSFVADGSARTLRGVLDGMAPGDEPVRRRCQRPGPRPTVGQSDDHEPRSRRADPVRLADHAVGVRHADACP